MRVIAFSGKSGAGKTWCSKYIMEMDLDTAVASFAGPLKHELTVKADVRPEVMRHKPWPDWLRALAQAWGDAKRAQNPRHYIDTMIVQLEAHWFSGHKLVVIDDLRYMNEMQY